MSPRSPIPGPSDPRAPRRERGVSFVEVSISAALLSVVFYAALTGYAGTMRASTAGTARLESMANSARALTAMNLELQEASVREETVEIYWIDPETATIAGEPCDPHDVPPPGTVYPTAEVVGDDSFALRFMTVGDFTTIGDTVAIEQAGPFLYRLGTGADSDFPTDKLVRIDESGADAPRVLCRGVRRVAFQRDSRGGALLITLETEGRDEVSGEVIPIRQVLTITPKNDFSSNISNFEMNSVSL